MSDPHTMRRHSFEAMQAEIRALEAKLRAEEATHREMEAGTERWARALEERHRATCGELAEARAVLKSLVESFDLMFADDDAPLGGESLIGGVVRGFLLDGPQRARDLLKRGELEVG